MNKNNFKAIVQARMGSTRLPGKALIELGGKPCMHHVITRLQKVKKIDEIIIATPDDPNNELLWEYCSKFENVIVYKGSTNDVLGRVTEAANIFRANNIVDITADCPLIDPVMIGEMIDSHTRGRADLTTNVANRCWPDGLDCQIYRRVIIEAAEVVVQKDSPHRLHSGWNIIAHLPDIEKLLGTNLHITSFVPPVKYFQPEWRLTLDEEDDAKTIDFLLRELGEECGWKDIMDYIYLHPNSLMNRKIQGKVPGEG